MTNFENKCLKCAHVATDDGVFVQCWNDKIPKASGGNCHYFLNKKNVTQNMFENMITKFWSIYEGGKISNAEFEKFRASDLSAWDYITKKIHLGGGR